MPTTALVCVTILYCNNHNIGNQMYCSHHSIIRIYHSQQLYCHCCHITLIKNNLFQNYCSKREMCALWPTYGESQHCTVSQKVPRVKGFTHSIQLSYNSDKPPKCDWQSCQLHYVWWTSINFLLYNLLVPRALSIHTFWLFCIWKNMYKDSYKRAALR